MAHSLEMSISSPVYDINILIYHFFIEYSIVTVVCITTLGVSLESTKQQGRDTKYCVVCSCPWALAKGFFAVNI